MLLIGAAVAAEETFGAEANAMALCSSNDDALVDSTELQASAWVCFYAGGRLLGFVAVP